MIKKSVFTAVVALLFPVFAFAATYDDLINSARMGDTRDVAEIVSKGASATAPTSKAIPC